MTTQKKCGNIEVSKKDTSERGETMDKKNKKKLKDAMKGDNFSELEKILGLKHAAISRRLNGHVDFSQPEMQKIAKHYNFSESQINDIFFS